MNFYFISIQYFTQVHDKARIYKDYCTHKNKVLNWTLGIMKLQRIKPPQAEEEDCSLSLLYLEGSSTLILEGVRLLKGTDHDCIYTNCALHRVLHPE